jgi:hypothetical protein
MAELTEAAAGSTQFWTVCLEASGPADLLQEAVRHAADLLFARLLPDGVRLSLGNSRSYAQWLYRQTGMHLAVLAGPPYGRLGVVRWPPAGCFPGASSPLRNALHHALGLPSRYSRNTAGMPSTKVCAS